MEEPAAGAADHGTEVEGEARSSWVVDMKMLRDPSVESERWKKQSIYRVPKWIKDMNNSKAYEPSMVSLGPLHHGATHLQPMEEHKQRALWYLVKRSGKPLEEFVAAVEEMADQLQDAYEERPEEYLVKLTPEENFVMLMITDGCFLLELFRMYKLFAEEEDDDGRKEDDDGREVVDYDPKDPIFSKHGALYMWHPIRYDMLRMENQLPLLLLQRLRAVEKGTSPMRNPKEVEKTEYNEFYKKTFNDFLDPLAYTHFTTEGEVEFRGVLYIPGMAPLSNEEIMNPKIKNIRLYVKRVFISDDYDGELFPRYLSFVKGVVDSNDLPLNVSREILQESCNHDEEINKMVLDFLGVRAKVDINQLGLHPLDIFHRNFNNGARDGAPHRAGCFETRYIFQRNLTNGARDLEIQDNTVPSAAKLYEWGIHFKSADDNFFNIHFKGGMLSMSKIWVHDHTETEFLNLMAFERLHVGAGNYVTAYAVFMDDIINTTRDVELLTRKEVIKNFLGSEEEVAKLFNTLRKGAVINESRVLRKVKKRVDEHRKKPWNRWRANLIQTNFSSPWVVISLVATLVQTVYTIIK